MSKAAKSILIIEDNQDIRESTAEILELADYEVYSAENGRKGVEIAAKQLPDLILCDIMMPELDGYGVLYLLNKNEQTANIPFIFITAKTERADIRKGMEMGADDYLTKPFGDMELLNTVETRLKKGEGLKKNTDDSSFDDKTKTARILTELVESSRVRTYKKKQVIFSEGDHLLHAFMIKTGAVRSYMVYQDGREIATGMYGPGEFFGYDSVLLNKASTDNAETLENTELHLISRDDFKEVIFKNPAISKKFIELLSGNLQEKQDQLLKMAYNSVRKRVADALVALTGKVDPGGQDQATVKISRDDLAAMVGTANETISRTLSDFKDEKLIEKEASSIKILSIDKLRKVKQ
ncbi:MAG: response regulator [Daejeonella sp.]